MSKHIDEDDLAFCGNCNKAFDFNDGYSDDRLDEVFCSKDCMDEHLCNITPNSSCNTYCANDYLKRMEMKKW